MAIFSSPNYLLEETGNSITQLMSWRKINMKNTDMLYFLCGKK
jgi:hypothetical protein